MSTEFSFGTDFTRDAGDFRSERGELVHHGVDGVLQLEYFASHIDRNFLRQVPVCHGGCHFGDVSYLVGEVIRHEIHVIREVFPGPGHALHNGLAAESSFGADFAGHARDFRSERGELIHHCVDGVLQLQNFASHFHSDFLGQVAVRHSSCDFGDVTHLRREVVRHEVHVVREIFPGTGHALHVRLAAQFSFGTDLTGHTCDFRRK